MATLVAAVINEWPGVLRRQHERKRSQFSASWTQTVNELTHEIDAVHARSAVLGLAVTPQELRQDNWIRASARPQHPGVILEFDLPNGEHVAFPCDTYYTWQDNVRAIALTLRALRTVERYGVTTRGEQYVGFQALPAGPSSDFAEYAIFDHFRVVHTAEIMATVKVADEEQLEWEIAQGADLRGLDPTTAELVFLNEHHKLMDQIDALRDTTETHSWLLPEEV